MATSKHKFRRPYPRRERLREALFIPILCTADIEPKIVNEFLERENDRITRLGNDDKFFLVTSAFVPAPTKEERLGCCLGGGISHTTVPVGSFESPYIGKTVPELREIWEEFYTGWPFTGAVFVVLDERTKREKGQKSCIIVADFRYKAIARCEFGLAAQLLGPPEWGIHDLNEGNSRDHYKDPEGTGEVFYTVEELERRLPTSRTDYVVK